MKEKLFEFIKEKTPNFTVVKILDFKIKDVDDEDGFVGEFYVVNCLLDIGEDEFAEEERTCLVDIEEFKRWVRNQESVKWLP